MERFAANQMYGRLSRCRELIRAIKGEKRIAKPVANPFVVRTAAEVADFFGVNARTVMDDWTETGMPFTKGAYDLSAIAKWKFARFRDELRNRQSGDAKERKEHAQADLMETKRDLLRGELVRRDDVVRSAGELLTWVKAGVERMPEDFAMMIPAEVRPEVRQRCEELCGVVLTRLSTWEPLSESDTELPDEEI